MLLLLCQVLSVSYGGFGLFLGRRSAERTDKKVIELRTEVEKLEQITQHLDERRKQQERIINDFDPDTLKCKSADLLEEIRKSENKCVSCGM